MLCFCLKQGLVERLKCCHIDTFKCLFMFYIVPLYLGFFSYISVMASEFNKPLPLAIFFILLIFVIEAFISCLFLKIFATEQDYDRQPLLIL